MENVAHEMYEAEMLNAVNRNSEKTYAAEQDKARAAKDAERSIRILNKKKWRQIQRFIAMGAIVCTIGYGHTEWGIPSEVFTSTMFAASVYLGWWLNGTVQLFRHMNRATRKG